ncbi:hypothetical protein, partial [Trichothermofontia sp.]
MRVLVIAVYALAAGLGSGWLVWSNGARASTPAGVAEPPEAGRGMTIAQYSITPYQVPTVTSPPSVGSGSPVANGAQYYQDYQPVPVDSFHLTDPRTSLTTGPSLLQSPKPQPVVVPRRGDETSLPANPTPNGATSPPLVIPT